MQIYRHQFSLVFRRSVWWLYGLRPALWTGRKQLWTCQWPLAVLKVMSTDCYFSTCISYVIVSLPSSCAVLPPFVVPAAGQSAHHRTCTSLCGLSLFTHVVSGFALPCCFAFCIDHQVWIRVYDNLCLEAYSWLVLKFFPLTVCTAVSSSSSRLHDIFSFNCHLDSTECVLCPNQQEECFCCADEDVRVFVSVGVVDFMVFVVDGPCVRHSSCSLPEWCPRQPRQQLSSPDLRRRDDVPVGIAGESLGFDQLWVHENRWR